MIWNNHKRIISVCTSDISYAYDHLTNHCSDQDQVDEIHSHISGSCQIFDDTSIIIAVPYVGVLPHHYQVGYPQAETAVDNLNEK